MDLGLVIPELQEDYQKGAFYRTIEILQEAQVPAIEIHASFILGKKEHRISKLNQELEARNIRISSVHGPFGGNSDLSSPSLIIRRRAISRHIETMSKMDIIKIPVLTIHPGGRAGEEKIPLREELFKKSLEILLKQAEKLRIKIAVENMLPLYPAEKITTIKKIMDEFSSPCLGACFDTGHANVSTGGVGREFQVIKDNVFDFHIHDNDGTKDMHLQPPYGNINWEEFFAAVENIKYQRPLMLESLPWQDRELSWMMKEVEMLKDNKILKKESPKDHFLRCKKCGHFIYGSESNPICYCVNISA